MSRGRKNSAVQTVLYLIDRYLCHRILVNSRGTRGRKYYVVPKSNTEFWQKKIERNRERDRDVQQKLASMGWHSITLWECQLKPGIREKTLKSLAFTLNHIFLEDHKVR